MWEPPWTAAIPHGKKDTPRGRVWTDTARGSTGPETHLVEVREAALEDATLEAVGGELWKGKDGTVSVCACVSGPSRRSRRRRGFTAIAIRNPGIRRSRPVLTLVPAERVTRVLPTCFTENMLGALMSYPVGRKGSSMGTRRGQRRERRRDGRSTGKKPSRARGKIPPGIGAGGRTLFLKEGIHGLLLAALLPLGHALVLADRHLDR